MVIDRIITFLLFAVAVTFDFMGYAVLAIFGYGWLWGPKLPYGAILRHPVSNRRMEGFYSGLVVSPVAISLAVSLAYGQPLVAIVVSGSLVVLLLFHRYFEKNLFIPILGGGGLALMLVFACLMRLSVMLLFFFFYVVLVFIGPVLLALLLAWLFNR